MGRKDQELSYYGRHGSASGSDQVRKQALCLLSGKEGTEPVTAACPGIHRAQDPKGGSPVTLPAHTEMEAGDNSYHLSLCIFHLCQCEAQGLESTPIQLSFHQLGRHRCAFHKFCLFTRRRGNRGRHTEEEGTLRPEGPNAARHQRLADEPVWRLA